MAAVALSHNITRQEDFEPTIGGTIGGTGGGPAASGQAGLHYEGAEALSRRIASTGGHGFDYAHNDIGTVDMYAADFFCYLFKGWTVLGAALNPGGMLMGIGDADGSVYAYQLGDDGTMGDAADFEFPVSGGYVFYPVEGRVNAWHTLPREATPDISVQVLVEVIFDVNATTGAGLSSALDSIDYTEDGLFAVGGDGGDADLVFQDFVDADEGAGLTGAARAGLWRSVPAGFQCFLNNVIGRTDGATVTATVMTDSGFSVTFPGGLVSEGRNGLEFDLGNASTVITLSDGTIKGSDRRFGGRSKIKRYFDTDLDVSDANDRITIVGHGFRTGDAVIYADEGGTEDIGPDDINGEAEFNTAGAIGTGAYWYLVRFDDDEISFHPTPDDAYSAAPTNEALTASTAGNGENHSLTRAPDTRPNILFVGNSGSALFIRVTLTLTRIITLTDAVTLISGVIGQGRQMILADATLTNCIIANPTTGIGEAYLVAIHANDLDLIDGTSFDSGGEGHAIEVTTDGTVAQDQAALESVLFSDYFASDEDNTGGWSFNASTDVDATPDDIEIIGHGFSTGDPVYYSDEGGTAIGGLTDQNLFYLRADDVDNVGVFLTKSAAIANTQRIALTAGSSETHKFYSANAAFFNNTGTLLTLNVSGGDSPTIRNSAGSTTVVNNTVTLTVQCDDANNPVEGVAVRIENASTGALIAQGNTNASGTFTDASFNYTGDLAILTKARLKGFFFDRQGGTITIDGLTASFTLRPNPIVDLP